jgi:hypothetical protein
VRPPRPATATHAARGPCARERADQARAFPVDGEELAVLDRSLDDADLVVAAQQPVRQDLQVVLVGPEVRHRLEGFRDEPENPPGDVETLLAGVGRS